MKKKILIIIIVIILLGLAAWNFYRKVDVNTNIDIDENKAPISKEIMENKPKVNTNISTGKNRALIFKKIMEDKPENYASVPKTRQIKIFSNLDQYKSIFYQGLEFKSPWGDGKDISNPRSPTKTLEFPNGKKIALIMPLSYDYPLGENVSAMSKDKIAKRVNQGEIKYNYNFWNYILSSNPNLIDESTPEDEAYDIYDAYNFKIFAPIEGVIYKFEKTNLKAFQFVKNTNNKAYTIIWIFGPDKKYEIISFSALTNDDVDLIVSSAKGN